MGAVQVGGAWNRIAFVSFGNEANTEVVNQKFPEAHQGFMIFSVSDSKDSKRVEKRGGKGPGPSLGVCLVWGLKDLW